MHAFPGGFRDCDKQLNELFAVSSDRNETLVVDVIGLRKQLQPVQSLVGFFERNVHLVSEISLALGVFRLANQRATIVPFLDLLTIMSCSFPEILDQPI